MSAEPPPIQRLAGDPPSPYEGPIGFSRIVVAGPWVLLGGTTSVDPSGCVLGATPYEQTLADTIDFWERELPAR